MKEGSAIYSALNELLEIKNTAEAAANESDLRQKIQNLYLYAATKEMKNEDELRKIIYSECSSVLRRLMQCGKIERYDETVNLYELCDEVCLACDLYLCRTGRRILFLGEEDDLFCRGSAALFSNALLNLITNA